MKALITIFILTFIISCKSITLPTAINSNKTITGTVSYRERIALPVNAKLIIKLNDVSLMDVKAKLLAEKNYVFSKNNPAKIPFNFEINYLPEEIDPSHSYSIQAVITVDNKMIFTNTQSYPVITRKNTEHVDMIVQHVRNHEANLEQVTDYICKNNQQLTVSFTSMNNKAVAIINGPYKQVIILPAKQVASGFFYNNGKHSLRGKGDDVQWTIGKMMPINCTSANNKKVIKAIM